MHLLVIAPHPDDETIGTGGTICNRAARGDRVCVVFLTSGELGLKRHPRAEAWRIREAEARRAGRILGVAAMDFLRIPDWDVRGHLREGVRLLQPILEREAPGRIYVPHAADAHPDHQAALPLLRAALRTRPLRSVEVLGYEVWTPLSSHDQVEDISEVMARKVKALRAHRSQLDEFDYLRAVRGLNQFRGELAARCRYAEVFQTLSTGSQ